MPLCYFAADLHGSRTRYEALAECVRHEHPAAIFLGGDLLPHVATGSDDFIERFLCPLFLAIASHSGTTTFLILGNDDLRAEEQAIVDAGQRGAWIYAHNRHVRWEEFEVYGYACVPPTPFLLKDWERYDVSRQVEPGCVSPEQGVRSVAVTPHEARTVTIASELASLAGNADLARAIFLFHAPPYRTTLDRAALDGRMVDYAPVDVHVGSIAVHRFIERRQPLISLHGHVHESARLTGAWQDRLGRTTMFSAAHDGPELALVRFDPAEPTAATRELIRTAVS